MGILAYVDCISGISGDMILGAFVDLGVPLDWLENSLKGLPLSGFSLSRTHLLRHGIRACKVHVRVDESQPFRSYTDIRFLVEGSLLSLPLKNRSLEILERLADAESKIHGCVKEEVHFHEIGGVDTMVDIIGALLCAEYLGIQEVISSPIPLGSGVVSCAHGTLPVPAPATLAILTGIPVKGTDIPHELATPTGAAIITSMATHFGSIPEMVVEKVGYGAGSREIDSLPNILRILLGRRAGSPGKEEDQVSIIECCIDDMNPEFFGFLMERLFQDGALDVFWIPVFMKKNRPATMVQVVSRNEIREQIIRRILFETTTLGVRFTEAGRRILPRKSVPVQTRYGEIPAKQVTELDGRIRMVPEYEACRKVAIEKGIPLRIVYDELQKDFEGLDRGSSSGDEGV
ncbi:MAG: nickel pincer cofactor biosynthesis protein LarC [Thermodesulfobacteriota bacterium]